jgi:hypothetical protein
LPALRDVREGPPRIERDEMPRDAASQPCRLDSARAGGRRTLWRSAGPLGWRNRDGRDAARRGISATSTAGRGWCCPRAAGRALKCRERRSSRATRLNCPLGGSHLRAVCQLRSPEADKPDTTSGVTTATRPRRPAATVGPTHPSPTQFGPPRHDQIKPPAPAVPPYAPPHPPPHTQSVRGSHTPNGGRVAAASSVARSIACSSSPPTRSPSAAAAATPSEELSRR